MRMTQEEADFVQSVYALNRASKKQCKDCIHYVAEYKDDFTLRHFGYGKVKIRPACSNCGNYSYVEHNPARLCRSYKKRNNENKGAL